MMTIGSCDLKHAINFYMAIKVIQKVVILLGTELKRNEMSYKKEQKEYDKRK